MQAGQQEAAEEEHEYQSSQAAVVGDYDGDEEQGLHCGDHGTHEDAIISEFNAAIEAGNMGLARSMFTQIAQTM